MCESLVDGEIDRAGKHTRLIMVGLKERGGRGAIVLLEAALSRMEGWGHPSEVERMITRNVGASTKRVTEAGEVRGKQILYNN